VMATILQPVAATKFAGMLEVAWAWKVIASFDLPENADKGRPSDRQAMVERLHGEMARQVVAMAPAPTRGRYRPEAGAARRREQVRGCGVPPCFEEHVIAEIAKNGVCSGEAAS
jgi:hypothetical protein